MRCRTNKIFSIDVMTVLIDNENGGNEYLSVLARLVQKCSTETTDYNQISINIITGILLNVCPHDLLTMQTEEGTTKHINSE